MPETNKKKIYAFVVEYSDFLKLPEEKRQKMLAYEQVEWHVYIPREKIDSLTPEEREQLKGFKITGIEPIKIRTFTAKEVFPEQREISVLINSEFKSKHDKKAEHKLLKRNVPLKIGTVNTKRKGGR